MKIIEGTWKNYGMTFIEYIRQEKNSNFKINGEKNLSNLINNKKQVIFISGHFANFELMSMAITQKQIL